MEIVDEWVTAIVLRPEEYGTRLGGNAPPFPPFTQSLPLHESGR